MFALRRYVSLRTPTAVTSGGGGKSPRIPRGRSSTMLRSLVIICAVLGFTFAAPAAQVDARATVIKGTVSFDATPGCLFFADVALGVCGTSGSVDFHIVLMPTGGENSHFDVHDFTGCVTTLAGCIPGFIFPSPVSALVVLHLGDQPTKPFVLVNHGPPGVPHRISISLP